jgi:hypothetical protein
MGSTLSQVGFNVGLGWLVSAHSSHSIHKVKEVGPQNTKGVGTWQRDVFATEPSGIMEVAMWLCAPLLVGL